MVDTRTGIRRERHILYVLEVCVMTVKLNVFSPYGAYYYAKPERLELFVDAKGKEG